MKNTKNNAKQTINLNTKERTLLREIAKHSGAVEQSLLFCAFERKSAVKAKNHERAGWAVRNSVRKLINTKLVVRVERGTVKLTNKGAQFVKAVR